MPFIQLNYRSDALNKCVNVNVILPVDVSKEYKTLYLLHGLGGDETVWMRETSIERYAKEYGIAVVMPNVDRSWYTDTAYGANYFTFVSKELPRVCRSYFKNMSPKREDNFIAGLSMGGYGAMKIALLNTDTFAGVSSLSGTLDIILRDPLHPLNYKKGIFGYDLESYEDIRGTEHDLFSLVKNKHAEGATMPKIHLWCGESDQNFDPYNRFSALLTELGIEHLYEHSEGDHSWKWWDKHIRDTLKYFFGKE
jgi:putative tributyrin esterase